MIWYWKFSYTTHIIVVVSLEKGLMIGRVRVCRMSEVKETFKIVN